MVRAGEQRLKLMFFGTPPFAARCLEALLDGPHPVVAVVTRPDRPTGRGMLERPSAVKTLALAHSLPLLQPATAKGPELRDAIERHRPDLGVVVAYGRILPADVLAAAPLGFINAHASLLPALRGAAPIERAILEGYRETGVTIMQMNERMDAGAIIAARSLPIDEEADRETLTSALAEVAAELLPETIDAIARGTATRTPQDESQATYAPPIDKHEAAIDWTEPAENVARRVRAFRPRPGAYAFDNGRRLKILDARPTSASGEPGAVLRAEDAGILVACGEGAVLVSTVQPEGKRPMPVADYLRGRKGPPLSRLDGGR